MIPILRIRIEHLPADGESVIIDRTHPAANAAASKGAGSTADTAAATGAPDDGSDLGAAIDVQVTVDNRPSGAKIGPVRRNVRLDAGFFKDLRTLRSRLVPRSSLTLDDHEIMCRRVGVALFTGFLDGPVLDETRKYLAERGKQGEQPRVSLELSRSLYFLPWELLRETDGPFLSRIGSLIRNDRAPNSLYEPLAHIRFTCVFPSPFGHPQIFGIPFATKRIHSVDVVPPTLRDFDRQIRGTARTNGFLFLGHGELQKSDGTGVLLFVQPGTNGLPVPDPRTGAAIGESIAVTNVTRIALILACESAWAETRHKFERSVVGAIFDKASIAYLVGAQTPIDQIAAREFATQLVQALEDNEPFDLAVGTARRAIDQLIPNESQQWSAYDWWIPVLYSRTDNFDVMSGPNKPALIPAPLPTPGGQPTSLATSAAVAIDLVADAVRSRPEQLAPEPTSRPGVFRRLYDGIVRTDRDWLQPVLEKSKTVASGGRDG